MDVGRLKTVDGVSSRSTWRWLVSGIVADCVVHRAWTDQGHHHGSDDFGRLFNLPAFAPPNPRVQAALGELGKRGGLMDANDNLAAGPSRSSSIRRSV